MSTKEQRSTTMNTNENTKKNYGTFETPFGTATVTQCSIEYAVAELPAGLVVNRVAHSEARVVASSSRVVASSYRGDWNPRAHLRREDPKSGDYSYDRFLGTDAAEAKILDAVAPRLLEWIEENDAAMWSGEIDRRAARVNRATREVQTARQALAEREAELAEVQAELAQAEWMHETLEQLDEAPEAAAV